MKKQSNIAQIAIFFAIMLVIHLLSSVIFNLFPVPIKPTIVHIPVIIASIWTKGRRYFRGANGYH